jgi:hypothetical protein
MAAADPDEALLFAAPLAAAARTGGPKKGSKKPDNISFSASYGTESTYLAAVIKRDYPEIAKAVERGEYKPMRAARLQEFLSDSCDVHRRKPQRCR